MNGIEKKDVLNKATLDPHLVHRVLLTDPSQFSALTVSGRDHLDRTPTFDDFCNEFQPSSNQSLEDTMKRAYRDKVCDVVYTSRNIQPLQQLLLELHQAIRSLVPNRKDLHSILKDDEVKKASSPEQLLPLVVEAGDALCRLESEARSETTQMWTKEATSDPTRKAELRTTIEFLVNSMMYLMLKAEMCEMDKRDFFLANVWAPQIHNKGYTFERQAFEAQFGKLDDSATAPLTRQWIKELVAQANTKELIQSESAREELVKKGWIQEILFRGPDRPALSMPEILALDMDQLRSIRHVTRTAAAGSALALHACNAAGVPTSVLNEPLEASSPLDLRRMGVAEAMASQLTSKTSEEYEDNVANAVVRLAKEWNPSLGSDAEKGLRNQTKSVLRAEDPVIRLLDSRMKEIFTLLVTWKPSPAEVDMKSGRAANAVTKTSDSSKAFTAAATKSFSGRGLSFYSLDLASVSLQANKVADLAWAVYGDCLLDRMILDACRSGDDKSS